MAHRKILLIDDQLAVTFTLERVLTKHGGYEVLSVNDPRAAVQAALDFQPDLIIMDIIMPHLDGSDLAIQMRRHPQLARIPVIFFSGILSSEEAGTYRQRGTGPLILSKAAGVKDLVRTVGRVLAGAANREDPVVLSGTDNARQLAKVAVADDLLYPGGEVNARSA